MATKAKIKVVKRKDVGIVKKVNKNETKVTKETAREMVTNVSSWVNDFQKRKREETKIALESLFPKAPHTESL